MTRHLALETLACPGSDFLQAHAAAPTRREGALLDLDRLDHPDPVAVVDGIAIQRVMTDGPTITIVFAGRRRHRGRNVMR